MTAPTRAHRLTRPRLTAAEMRRADELLADGVSFADVARTLGRSKSAICRRFPGRGWTAEQVAERASLERRFRGVL